MVGLKRKRGNVGGYSAGAVGLAGLRPFAVVAPPARRARRAFVPGRDRVGGYYGRYRQGGGGAELKFHDVDLDDAVVANNGDAVTPTINIIAQGVTESTRVGRKCTIRSINWKWRAVIPVVGGAAGFQSDTLRIILFWDKQCNGGTVLDTDILETPSFLSFRNLANSGRFIILCDKSVNLNYLASAGDGAVNDASEMSRQGAFYKNCNIPIEYNNVANDGSLVTIRSNNLGVLLISEGGTCGFFSKIRLRFSDN